MTGYWRTAPRPVVASPPCSPGGELSLPIKGGNGFDSFVRNNPGLKKIRPAEGDNLGGPS